MSLADASAGDLGGVGRSDAEPGLRRTPGLTADAFRPVQYLGSKLRALAPIADVVEQLSPSGGRVLDAFAGSTVVAQVLALHGRRVFATDAMEFAVTFARALLGVGRPERSPDAEDLLGRVLARRTSLPVSKAFAPLADEEREALERRDAERLLRMTRNIPQVFDARDATPAMVAAFARLQERIDRSALDVGGLVTCHYAGTYFGVRQAIAIDELRVAIEAGSIDGGITAWERDVLLTALLSAVSDCAFTPGKHFAQPHRVDDAKDLTFLRGRVVQDRAIDVERIFRERVHIVHERACAAGRGHGAVSARVEDLARDPGRIGPCDVVYTDPPYTAQQYSRFYHVPEVIVRYVVPRLQRKGGTYTSGLYPEQRYLSPFCSKRAAPAAFRGLTGLARALGAALVVSYSATASGQTGNARMISFDELLETLRAAGTVRVIELGHAYRQFNSEQSAVEGRADKEYLLVCKPSS